MKMIKNVTLLLMTFVLVACEIDEQIDPNSPSLEGVEQDASVSQLNNLVIGTIGGMRDEINTQYDVMAIIGREGYRFSGSDPRFVADLLNGTLDFNAFYTTRPFGARYRVIKNANILITAAQNTGAIDEEEIAGYLGFAKTIKAHELLMVANLQYNNGIRINVEDPDNLGPFTSSPQESYTAIAALLDEGADHLTNAAPLLFPLPMFLGFEGVSDLDRLTQFNRALAARVAIYMERFDEALGFLENSFLDLEGNYDKGAYHLFSTNSGDRLNPIFLPLDNTGENRLAHPSFITDAEEGDTRLSKAAMRTPVAEEGPGPASSAGLTSNYDVALYASNTAPVGIIRNEELVLLYAEAQIQTNHLTEALEAINNIRNNADLPDYSGPVTQEALINEMLEQRRYSLWYEGHRWVDLRRYNRLEELPLDRTGDVVHQQFPRPFTELEVQGG